VPFAIGGPLEPSLYLQGRLHHINDGANAPWKKVRGEVFAGFFRKLRGKLIVALISSANYHLI